MGRKRKYRKRKYRKRKYRKRKYRRIPTKVELMVILLLSVIMGTIFTFLTPYMNSPVERADARHIEASFSDYKEVYGNRKHRKSSRIAYIMLYFSDCNPMEIDGICATDELSAQIAKIPKNERVSMLVHPASDTVLELKTGETVYLEFEESVEKLSSEAGAFRIMGIVIYASGGYALYLLWKKKYMRYTA